MTYSAVFFPYSVMFIGGSYLVQHAGWKMHRLFVCYSVHGAEQTTLVRNGFQWHLLMLLFILTLCYMWTFWGFFARLFYLAPKEEHSVFISPFVSWYATAERCYFSLGNPALACSQGKQIPSWYCQPKCWPAEAVERAQREIQTSAELDGLTAKQKIGAMTSSGPITTFKVCCGLKESRFQNH